MAIFKTRYHIARNVTCIADAALVGGQVVKVTTGDIAKPGVSPTAAKGELAIGVVDVDAAIGDEVSVTTEFFGPLEANGAITAGDKLTADIGGTVSVATEPVYSDGTTAGSAGDPVFALAVQDAAAAGDQVSALKK